MPYNKYYKQKKQVSYDEGVTWSDVTPPEYQKGALYEENLPDCQQTGTKFQATYSDGTTREVDCNGDGTLTSGETQPSVAEYSGVTDAIIGECVTIIGKGAFRNGGTYLPSLTAVTIPNSVTTIGDRAFESSISTIKRINSNIDWACNIPNSVTSIGEWAFEGCVGFTTIDIPNSVTSIGGGAFFSCYNLTSVTIPNSVTSISDAVFQGCSGLTSVTIPNSVTTIGTDAFYGCSSLTSIAIPKSVTRIICYNPLRSCYNLTSITVDANNTVYDSRNGCNAIIETSTNELISGCKTTVIPNSVTSIGEHAFYGCSSLTSITIPNSVTSIGGNPWHGCYNLTSITVDANNAVYDSRNGCNAIIETSTNELISGCKTTVIPNSVTSIGKWAFGECSSLTSITIPDSVTSINYSAFWGCSSLTSVTIGNSVTSIGKYAFTNCSSITSVTIPNSVATIDRNAFAFCSSLTSITIPNSVTSIGLGAFDNCRGLTSVTVNATTPPTLGTDAFYNTNNCPIYVPASSLGTYKSASGWSYYSSRIQAIP